MPKFLPALDQTLELKVVIACTNPPPPEAIGLGDDLEERTRKLGSPSLGPEDLGWGRAMPTKPGKVKPPPSATLESSPTMIEPRVSIPYVLASF
jgi:hypothetical protein